MDYDGCATTESKYAIIVPFKAVFVLKRISYSNSTQSRKNTT